MIEKKGFNEKRINTLIERMGKAKGKANQTRMDAFFSFAPKAQSVNPAAKNAAKSNGKDKAGKSMGHMAAKKGKKGIGKKKGK
ncbi:MAG: hypothetical protein MJ252_04430 [archaeon]|nr:hypothetical protein [archaeon]